MRDQELILRAADVGDLEVTEEGDWIDLCGLPRVGIDFYIVIPEQADPLNSLIIMLEDGDDGTDPVDIIHQFAEVVDELEFPMTLHAPLATYRRYIRLTLTVDDGDGASNFGAVEAWLALGPFKIANE